MLTPAIVARVRDNLGRNESGVDARIQSWVDDTKHRLEQARSMDYMRARTLGQITTVVPTVTLPARFKALLAVRVRRTLPAPPETVWTPLPPLSEEEVLQTETFEVASPDTGTPLGYTLEESVVRIRPAPTSGDTYDVAVAYYTFSSAWTFAPTEEPYLAKFAWQALIDGATAIGYSQYGQMQDAAAWERTFLTSASAFMSAEMRRSLPGEVSLRVRTGAGDHRASVAPMWGV